MLAYYISAIISWAGTACGAALAHIAEEELKPGFRYFILLQDIFISLAIFFAASSVARNHAIAAASAGAVFLLLAACSRRIRKAGLARKTYWAMAALGGLLYITYASSSPQELGKEFAGFSSSVFLFGLASGSILAFQKEKAGLIIAKSTVYLGIAAIVSGLAFLR